MKTLKIAVSLFIVAGVVAATSARDAVPPEVLATPAAARGGAPRLAPYDGAMKDILAELRNNPEFVAKVEAARVRLAADPDYRARVEARWPRGKARPN